MKLTIIVPTHNCESVIRRCIESIVNQEFQDWELLVIDALSTDGTLEVIRHYSLYDSRIRVYSEPDNGIYDAMNKGIDRAQGHWLYFMGGDDFFYNSSSLKGIFNNCVDDYDIVYGTVYAPHWEDKYKDEWHIENYMDNRCHQAIFYKRSFFGKRLRYDTRYKVCADFAINLMWFLSPKYSSHYYPVVIANYSDGGYSSYTIDHAFHKDQPGIALKHGHKVLPIAEKKRLAWWYMDLNPEKRIVVFLMKIYVIYLRIIAKLSFS